MTRHECEEKLLEKLEEIREIYHEYYPEGKYLAMTYGYSSYSKADYVSVNNAYWHDGEDEAHVITATRNLGVSA